MSTDIKTLRNALSAMHAVACGDSTRPYMSIPADPERDADLLLSGALDELEDLRAERDARLIAAAPSYAKAWAMVPEEIRERILSAIDSRDAEAIDRVKGSTK